MKIIKTNEIAFIRNLTKAYTEGVYADTPANRKLGRVGMSYAQYAQKVSGEGEKKQKDNNKEISNDRNFTSPSELKKEIVGGLPWKANPSKFGPQGYTVFFSDGSKLEWDKNHTQPRYMKGNDFVLYSKDKAGNTKLITAKEDNLQELQNLYNIIKDNKKELIDKTKSYKREIEPFDKFDSIEDMFNYFSSKDKEINWEPHGDNVRGIVNLPNGFKAIIYKNLKSEWIKKNITNTGIVGITIFDPKREEALKDGKRLLSESWDTNMPNNKGRLKKFFEKYNNLNESLKNNKDYKLRENKNPF